MTRRRIAVGLASGLLCGLAGMDLAAAREDVAPDPKLRRNRETYHPAMDVLKAKSVRLTDKQMEKLKGFPLEAVWATVQRLGYTNAHMSGLLSTRSGERLVGRALTIRYLPRRPDLVEAMQTLFRADAFNLFNTPQFGFPNSAIGSPTAGRITTTIGDNRSMQFALKLEF